MPREKLSEAKIEKLIKKPGCYGDGAGLWLLVKPTGAVSWVHRFMLAGKAYARGLGPYPIVKLDEARELHLAAQRALRNGHIAPIAPMTFGQALDEYHEKNRASWSPQHAVEWRQALITHAGPLLDLPVAQVTTESILGVLLPIWRSKHVTAGRVRQRIEQVLASVKEQIPGENPARLKGHLEHKLPRLSKRAKEVEPLAALPFAKLPDFMTRLRQEESLPARALEFAILNCSRAGEVLGATWSEIDFKGRLWVISGQRMKGRKEHRVPLSEPALKILAGIPRDGDRIFPLGKNAMTAMAQAIEPAITAHGFRSTFSDWAHETTHFPREIVEMALAHTVGNKVERAYRRGDLLQKRRELADAWANAAGA